MKKKSLLLSLIITFVVSVVGINITEIEAMASEEYTCVCNGEYYTSWVNAAEELDDNGISGIIQMIADETMTEHANLAAEGVTITLDLNGKNVNYPDCDEYTGVQINPGVTFVLDDSVGTGTYSVGNDNYGMIFVAGGSFIMNGGSIISNENKASNEHGIYSFKGSTTIAGGKIKTRFPFYIAGKHDTAYLTMTGGELIGEINSVVEGDAEVNISGGSIYCEDDDSPALVLGMWDYNDNGLYPRVKISGGEFHNPNYAGIKIFSYENDSTGLSNFDNFLTYGYEFSNPEITDDGSSYLTAPYVKVAPIESIILFDANGGQVSQGSKKVLYSETYGELPTPTRTGYSFEGWYTGKTSGVKITEQSKVDIVADSTLYARWKKEPEDIKTVEKEKIKANKSNTKITGIRDKVYTGKKLELKIKVVCNGKTLTNKKDYTVKYSSNKNVGTASVKITFKGDYTGTITKTFKINPKASSITKITAGKKNIQIRWTKRKVQVDGYQMYYSTSKIFKSKKVVNIKNTNITKTTIKKLKSNKKYYVKIRTYKVVKGKTYYSTWSQVKNIKVK